MTFRKLRKLRRLIGRFDNLMCEEWAEMCRITDERNVAVDRLRELIKDGEISC